MPCASTVGVSTKLDLHFQRLLVHGEGLHLVARGKVKQAKARKQMRLRFTSHDGAFASALALGACARGARSRELGASSSELAPKSSCAPASSTRLARWCTSRPARSRWPTTPFASCRLSSCSTALASLCLCSVSSPPTGGARPPSPTRAGRGSGEAPLRCRGRPATRAGARNAWRGRAAHCSTRSPARLLPIKHSVVSWDWGACLEMTIRELCRAPLTPRHCGDEVRVSRLALLLLPFSRSFCPRHVSSVAASPPKSLSRVSGRTAGKPTSCLSTH